MRTVAVLKAATLHAPLMLRLDRDHIGGRKDTDMALSAKQIDKLLKRTADGGYTPSCTGDGDSLYLLVTPSHVSWCAAIGTRANAATWCSVPILR